MSIAAMLFPPGYVFLDANGAPLASGTLTFYAAGTVTPQNTYSDSGLTIANANPLTLNADGYSTNAIYSSAAGYKVILKDSNGVQVWSYDNYGVAAPAF